MRFAFQFLGVAFATTISDDQAGILEQSEIYGVDPAYVAKIVGVAAIADCSAKVYPVEGGYCTLWCQQLGDYGQFANCNGYNTLFDCVIGKGPWCDPGAYETDLERCLDGDFAYDFCPQICNIVEGDIFSQKCAGYVGLYDCIVNNLAKICAPTGYINNSGNNYNGESNTTEYVSGNNINNNNNNSGNNINNNNNNSGNNINNNNNNSGNNNNNYNGESTTTEYVFLDTTTDSSASNINNYSNPSKPSNNNNNNNNGLDDVDEINANNDLKFGSVAEASCNTGPFTEHREVRCQYGCHVFSDPLQAANCANATTLYECVLQQYPFCNPATPA